MKLFELFNLSEDANTDVEYHTIASDMAQAAMSYIYENPQPDFEVSQNGKIKYYGFYPTTFGWNHYGYKNLLLLIADKEPRAVGVHGSISTLSPMIDGKYNRAVVVNCLYNGEISQEILKKDFSSIAVYDILLHEIIHAIDYKRSGDRSITASLSASTNSATYFNDSAELNAFYHNFADRIHNFIKHANEYISKGNYEYVLDYADMCNIFIDFSKTLKANMPRSGIMKQYITNLSDKNRKRALSRFYKVHKMASDLIIDALLKTNKE